MNSSHSTAAGAAANSTIAVGLVGARGYVGAELIRLLDAHGHARLDFVSSRALAGQPVTSEVAGFSDEKLCYEDLDAHACARRGADAYILALPNGHAAEYVAAIERSQPEAVIIDVSADYRFDDDWVYGLPERNRELIRGARRISNPGCYATGMQLGIAPALDRLDGSPVVFGVSGYSGAGTTPSDKNDPEKLRDNLMPYALVGHTHEREVSRHLNHSVRFMPHVAPFFRGITLTIALPLSRALTADDLRAIYAEAYAAEPLVEVHDSIPLVRDIANRHQVRIGGFTVDESSGRGVVVVTLDNLLKGAATQAVQNINLAFAASDELEGIRPCL
ncbi:MAG: N-acetyl-gamma-glutamyl-phosphate reductase [Phycisphaerales bacterium]